MSNKKNPTLYDLTPDLNRELDKFNSNLSYRLEAIETKLANEDRMINQIITNMQKDCQDHEDRLRKIEEGITTLKIKYDLSTGGALATSIAALIKSIFGV